MALMLCELLKNADFYFCYRSRPPRYKPHEDFHRGARSSRILLLVSRK